MNIDNFTMRCDQTPDCRHHICADCGTPMRPQDSKAEHHPGTRQKATTSTCFKCYKTARKTRDGLTDADLEDQRHHLMTNTEMARIRKADPHHYAFLMRRRQRLNLGVAA